MKSTTYGVGEMILDAMENIEIIKDKAKTGDVQSQIELAHAYLNGEGVAKNRAHYLKWLTKAAEQNNVDAQYELFQFFRVLMEHHYNYNS